MIHETSRYVNTSIMDDNNTTVLRIRPRLSIGLTNAQMHTFCAGDTLDGLAQKYYNSPHLWWVFLEVNTKYKTELDINYGDNLIIPNYNEVMKCLQY